MKHLLILLISILLLSSPVIGQETDVLYLWENGTKYMGEWKNGERHGQGTHTYPDGSKFEGDYKDDWELNGTQYDKNGNIKYKYVNGKQIKQ